MATRQTVQIGDTVNFLVTIRKKGNIYDISNAVLTFWFKKSDLTTASVVGGFATDGSDGVAKYTTLTTTFDLAGKWEVQIKTVDGAVVLWTTAGEFDVLPNIG